jgi:hypothetical protein
MEESGRSEQLSKTAVQVAWFTTGKSGDQRVNTNIQLTGRTERLDVPERLLRKEDERGSGQLPTRREGAQSRSGREFSRVRIQKGR